jgi:hypothetical protein
MVAVSKEAFVLQTRRDVEGAVSAARAGTAATTAKPPPPASDEKSQHCAGNKVSGTQHAGDTTEDISQLMGAVDLSCVGTIAASRPRRRCALCRL